VSKELIIHLFNSIDSRDWNALRDIFHPEVVYERPGYEPFVGINRLIQFYQNQRILASGKHNIECIVVDGNNGASCGRFIGLKKDNSKADEQFAEIYSFKNGTIKTRKSYFFRPAV
jgi:ketosteroid isomerase-like protein